MRGTRARAGWLAGGRRRPKWQKWWQPKGRKAARAILLGGNSTGGVALGRCVEFGQEKAAEVAEALKVSA